MKSGHRELLNFLKKILLFIIILLILDFALGFVFRKMVAKTRYGKFGGNINYILEYKPEILLMGNSRMGRHVNPQILAEGLDKTVFNGGMDSIDIYFQITLLKYFIENGYKPDRIILEFSRRNFNEKLYRDFENLLVFSDCKAVKDQYIRISPFNRLKLLLRSYAFNSKIEYILKEMIRPEDKEYILGYKPVKGCRIKTGKKPEEDDNLYNDKIVDYYIEFFELCRDSDIKLTLMESPTYIKDSRQYPPKIIEYIESDKISIMKSTELFSENDFSREDFYDYGHLNAAGADKFSKILLSHMKGSGYNEEN